MSRDTPPRPALAKLSHEPSFKPGWIYERKRDGERCLATNRNGGVRLWTRSRRDVSGSFPELVDALAAQAEVDFVVDGEVVAFERGRTSFGKLQPRIHVTDPARARATGIRIWYYLFDVLETAGDDIRRTPLRERKAILRDLLTYWLKFKCEARQEFVIGGWTDPEGSRTGFGALLLGYYGGKEFVYAGKVGTGFSRATLEDLRARMDRLEATEPAFDHGRLPTKGVHWLKPELVCEVAFTEWTEGGQLRHPRYLGLRRDKSPTHVVRE